MIVPNSSSFYTVTDPKQAHMLTDPKSKAFFKPFLARERSASQAAEALGCTLNAMHYRVKTLLKTGLICVIREEKRRGRAVKYYRSRHDAYFVPFNLTPYATLEERLGVQAAPIFANLLRAYVGALRQSERYGNYLFRGDNGAVYTSDLLPDLTPAGLPVVYSDTVTRLPDSEARELGRDLRELFERGVSLGNRKNERSQGYMLMVALLPLGDARET